MKAYIFGSCSGTEPFEKRHHTSFALEINGQVYWFDAGENCSYTAHLLGVDLLSVSDIFISHGHMDHVGGLPNLLWNIRKLSYVKHTMPKFDGITVHMPNNETFDGVMTILKNTEDGYRCKYETRSKRIRDAVIMEDENASVEAIHNLHLPEAEEGFISFSFRLKAEGKKVVYSGDMKSFDDIMPFVKEGCDALFVETGHHSAVEICKKIADENLDVKKLFFIHHGMEILTNYEDVLSECRKINPTVTFCNDKDVFDI